MRISGTLYAYLEVSHLKTQKEILEQHKLLTALGKKYPGRYVALLNKKVLAMGKNQLSTFKIAEKKMENKKEVIGVYYLPSKKKTLYLLKAS